MLVAPSCFPIRLRHCYSMRISCSPGFVFPTSDLLHLSGLGSSACPLIKNTTTELPIEGDALACPLPTHKKRMQLVRAALNAGALYAVHGPHLSWTPGMRSCDFYIEVHTYMHGMNGVSLQNSRLASPGLFSLPRRSVLTDGSVRFFGFPKFRFSENDPPIGLLKFQKPTNFGSVF